MSSSPVEPADLLDLRLLPAWVKEPAEANGYEHYTGREERRPPRNHRTGKGKRSTFKFKGVREQGVRQPTTNKANVYKPEKPGMGRGRQRRHRGDERGKSDRHSPIVRAPLEILVRFLPYPPAFENVTAQIKSGSVAYSLFALARLFLEKPERYEVRLTAKAKSPLFQLGENGVFSPDREFLERNAFRFAHENFYKIDITQSDPIKGDFSNVARCRLSGTLLGPTNHHNYQPQLRGLYEQRFSRRMSFTDYERQIEIVNDPALVDRWKEEARTVTTYTTLCDGDPLASSSATEAERHFRANYLPGLIRTVEETIVGGVLSRHLPDRMLNRAIEEAWTRETRSPSNIMQELASQFRQAGLNIFRHRRGMLFVSPVRPRPFVHDHASVSPAVNAILEAVAATTAINRKELFEKLIADPASNDAESRKLALASNLHWLVSEGYVLEFNDGSLDLPRAKAKSQTPVAAVESGLSLPNASTAEPMEQAFAVGGVATELGELEIGGS